MARLPNGCSRMLCALLQFGSEVSAVNRPSPATARTRRSGPRTALSKRFSSESSSTRSWPETITIGAPIMSSQKIGPNSLASRVRFCTGALESSDSMLPTTGLVGGCGIGLSLFFGAIFGLVPHCHSGAIRSIEGARMTTYGFFIACAPRNDVAATSCVLPKPLPAPLDQLGRDLLRLFLLRPMAAAAHQIFLEVGNELLHAVGGRRRQHLIVLGHDHQRRHAYGMIETGRALPVARHVAIPVDAAGEAGFLEGIDEHLPFLGRQDRRTRIVPGVVTRDHLRKRQINSR